MQPMRPAEEWPDEVQRIINDMRQADADTFPHPSWHARGNAMDVYVEGVGSLHITAQGARRI